MVVLSLQLQLITDQKAKLLLSLCLQLAQCLLEYGIELLLDVGGFGVDLFDLEVYLAEIVSELVFPSLNVGIYFLHLG